MERDSSLVLTLELCRPLLARLSREIENVLGQDLEAIALFGSVARSEGRKSSDIDLLIVHRRDREPLDEFVQVLLDIRRGSEYRALLEAGFYPEILPVFLNLESLAAHPWILLDVADHGKILFSQQGLIEGELANLQSRLLELGSRKVLMEDGTWCWDLKPDWQPHDTFDI